MDHYADAFTITPSRCFRTVQLEGVGHPDHCREPVAYRGRFHTENGTFRVEACEGHAHELTGAVVDLRACKRRP